MDLAKFNLATGAPVMMLDPNQIDLSGDASARIESASAPF
jgi:hypothetical protein